MSLSVPLTLNLLQRKVFTGYEPRTGRFAVQSSITANPLGFDGSSNPEGANAANAFVLAKTSGVDRERLVEMLDMANTEHLALPANPLNGFRDVSVDLSTYPADCTLRVYGKITSPPGVEPPVTTLPGEWATPEGQIDGYREFRFITPTSDDIALGRARIAETFLWACDGLRWELYSPSMALLTSGQQGLTERERPDLTLWRDRQFTAGFYEMPAALDHITFVQVHVKSVVKQANSSPQDFLTWVPGNPVTNTY